MFKSISTLGSKGPEMFFKVIEGSGLDSNREGKVHELPIRESTAVKNAQGGLETFEPRKEVILEDAKGLLFWTLKSRLEPLDK